MKPTLKFYLAVTICCIEISAVAQRAGRPLPRQPVSPPTSIPSEQPLNDSFAGRATIYFSGLSATKWISSSLSNTTSEVGEPLIEGVSSGQTVWGTWTAPSNGIVTFSVNAQTFSPLLTVYTGNDLASLSLIASNNYLACYEHAACGCHWRERNQITFHVTSGLAYQICVDSAIITDASWVWGTQTVSQYNFATWMVLQTTNALAGGTVQLGLQFSPAPKNDNFANRIPLSGSRVFTKASNAGATQESSEPNHAENPGGSSVWYSWTAPASGRVTLSTNEVPVYAPPSWSDSGSFGVSSWMGTIGYIPPPTCGNLVDQNPPPVFYPLFDAYTGSAAGSLTSANCLPLSLDAFPNAVEFDAVKGRTYQIAFDGNMGTTGDIPFYLALTKPASNDNFGQRIPLRGIYVEATGYNAGATHQASEPFFGDSAGKTVWWSWTAPVSGTVVIDLGGSDYPFPVAIFTGTTVGQLQAIAADSGGVSFRAVAGRTYQIAVTDASGLTGAIVLKLQVP